MDWGFLFLVLHLFPFFPSFLRCKPQVEEGREGQRDTERERGRDKSFPIQTSLINDLHRSIAQACYKIKQYYYYHSTIH